MNLEHFKNPKEFVSEAVEDARTILQEKFRMPDWAIDSLVFCVEDDTNCVTYGCAGLCHTEWDSIPDPGFLLQMVVAAGSAYLNGPESWRQAARYEFERVYQRWDIDTRVRNKQADSGRVLAKKIIERNEKWLIKALDLVREGKHPSNVASRIETNKDVNPAGIKAHQIRIVLKKKGFRQQ